MDSIFKKILKTFGWIVTFGVFLFLLIALLIQIPSIQNKLIQYATTFVSHKTQTKVEIQNISIGFPKSVVIEGLYLEDLQADTLLYAGMTKVNIALYDLIRNKISINSFDLDDVYLNLYNTKTDSLFNYNFLTTAFGDTTHQENPAPPSSSEWTFDIDNIILKNIRLRYNDQFAGMHVTSNLKNIELSVDEMDLKQSSYSFNTLVMEGVTANVKITKSNNTSETKSESVLPKLSANNIHLNNFTIEYIDSVNNQSVHSVINEFKLKSISIDLQKQLFSTADLSLSKSLIQYHNFATEPDTLQMAKTTSQSDWKVSMNSIELTDNSLIYQSGNKPEKKNSFDPDNLSINHLTFNASNIFYSADLTTASITKFSAIDKNNFTINRVETDFKMDRHSISTQSTKIGIGSSTLDADLSLHFSSLSTLKNSIDWINIDLDLRDASIQNADLLYFNPELTQQPFFKNRQNVTTASGELSGQINNLSAKNLVLKTGVNTTIKTNFNIRGLPKYQTANCDFPNLIITSGKQDLKSMADSIIPQSIDIPENITIHALFKGGLKSFKSTAILTSSFGDAKLTASIDPAENFTSEIAINNFHLGRLLKDTLMYGPLTLTAEANGTGLDLNTLKAKFKAEAPELSLNKYSYHHLTMDGTIEGKKFEWQVKMKDDNAVFDMKGLANLDSGHEHYKFNLKLAEANLQKLNLTPKKDRISFEASADITGGNIDRSISGNAAITNVVVNHEGKIYRLNSLLSARINETGKNETKVDNALIGINYSGTLSPTMLSNVLYPFINQYFSFSDSLQQSAVNTNSKFNFEIKLHNHAVLSEVMLPQLKEFEPGLIQGSFESEKNDLKLNARIKKILWGSTEINDFAIAVNSDNKTLNYTVSTRSISNTQAQLNNLLLKGSMTDNKMMATLSSIDGDSKKLFIRSQLIKEGANYKLTLDPKEFYLSNQPWNIAADHYFEFGKQGVLIHHFFMNHNGSQLAIASTHDQFNDELNINLKDFRLGDLSGIVQNDSNLVKGTIDGNILLKPIGNSYGIISDIKISKLVIQKVPVGTITLKVENPGADKFDLVLILSGTKNNMTAKGFFDPNGGQNSIHIQTDIQSLSLKAIPPLSMGQVTEASGILTGNILIEGDASAPDISGKLVFKNSFIQPAFLKNRLEVKNETIELKKEGIYFNKFTLLDKDQHAAIIDGAIKMKQFSDFIFDLQVNAKDFLLFNTTAKENNEFFGRMIIDSNIGINGPMEFPVIKGKIKVGKGSNFTFAVPEDQLTTDKGENVVEFIDPLRADSQLPSEDKKSVQTSGMTGLDLSTIIEIDKEASLRLLMDPSSTDSLVVKGEAALSFTIDKSGKISLTGAYNLSEGSYLASFESILKKKFDIESGSTIIWNGDLLDAKISINAKYSVRTSPYDLVADQISGLSETDQGGYKQYYPFYVILKLRGAILQPDISFEIQLPSEDKGILGGAVNQKLSLLNEDESALNKQVFALLVLNRFIQENPFQSETGGTSTLIRSTVSKFLSVQLNQLNSKLLPGMELNFDIQSGNDYESGQAKGRTQVEIGVKKQLFNDRLSVQIGGAVDVEGDRAKQNSASDLTGDVTVEYKLNKDGSFRLKGFRHNQYEGAIEGQLIETGAGIVFVRDFNRWKNLFKPHDRTKRANEATKEEK